MWQTSLTDAQSEALESLHKQALQIIYDDHNYDLILILADTDSLETHPEHMTAHFFKRQVLYTNSVLNDLLLPKYNVEAIDKLRNVIPYELI